MTPVPAALCLIVTLLNDALHTLAVFRLLRGTPGLVTGALLLVPVGGAGWLSIVGRRSPRELAAVWTVAVLGHSAIGLTAITRDRRTRGAKIG